ncbi:hypothetical protein AX15_007722 [Amanita polypyramis BW_CC]|nr:hypothetical protein AX15_007722 [Amanita polypyramis BW_CC]
MFRFVKLRHKFLLNAQFPQARTVLITTVPEDLASEEELYAFAIFVPGGVDKVWLYRHTRTLNELFQARADACEKLEEAHRKSARDEENGESEPPRPIPASRAILDELVTPMKRPKHKLGLFGLLGGKVNTINWCKAEIARLMQNSRKNRS